MTVLDLKRELLGEYHSHLEPIVKGIQASGDSHDVKAKLVNKTIAEYHPILTSKINAAFTVAKDKQQGFIVLQYCTSIVSLEYRHRVWPYEYMALSRRVGELWERFCSTAWDYPSREGVEKIDAPQFMNIRDKLKLQISQRVLDASVRKDLEVDVDILFDLVGEINMKEDVVFSVGGIPHVIDFKSGFGSNEKGNMLRLQTVGKAYRLWDHRTKLLFLVRQEENNNYLNVIKKSKLWEVYCGAEAYARIDELTGSDMGVIRSTVVKFDEDLSASVWSDLTSHLSDLTSYLRW